MELKTLFLFAVIFAVIQLIAPLPLPQDEPTKSVTSPVPENIDGKTTEKPTLGGKMLGAQMGYGSFGGFNNIYGSGSGMMGGFNPMMGTGMMGGMYPPMLPGGGLPAMGGSGYIPNWLQQYDMLYSRNRNTA